MLIVNANLSLSGYPGFSRGMIETRGAQIADVRGSSLPNTEGGDVIDAKGRVVLPGFIDSHAHLLFREFDVVTVELETVTDVDQIIAAVEEKVRELGPKRWIVGVGWDDSRIANINRLDRDLLDQTGLPNPMFLQRVCGHAAFLNSKALALLCSCPDYDGIGSHVNRATGEIREQAVHVARSLVQIEHSERVSGARRAIDEALAVGITTICEMHATPHQFEVLRDAAADIEVMVYMDHESDESFEMFRRLEPSNLCRPVGLKLVADGSIGARTAAVSIPYAGTDEHGILLLNRAEIAATARRALREGIQLAIHAIGDVAVDTVISAYEDADAATAHDHRHRLEHLELLPEPLEDALAGLKRTGMIASMQPDFIETWGRKDGLYGERFGAKWAETNAFGPVLRAGIPLCFGSDSMPIGPVYGLRGAVNHPCRDYAMSVEDAIEAYTTGGAFAFREEGRLGRIRAGMGADIVILDCREAEGVLDAKVDATIKAGKVVYRADGRIRTNGLL